MATLSSAFQQCATENSTCPISSPSAVAFVATDYTGDIFYRNPTADIVCNTSSFGGDPSLGHSKDCYSLQLPSDVANPDSTFYDANGNPSNWTVCGPENQTCNPLGTTPVDILFGSQKKFVYTNAASVPCETKIFGDPNPYVPKQCFWRTSSVNPGPPGPSPPGPPGPQPPGPPSPPRSRAALYIILAISGIILLIIIIAIIIMLTKKHND